MNLVRSSPPPTVPLQPAHTLPAELAGRADALLHNPDAYAFPALSTVVKGEPDKVTFDKVWEVAENPVHWGDDSYHKITAMEDQGSSPSHLGAWFEMTHRAFPLMPTIFGRQNFTGVVVQSTVSGDVGQRVGTVTLAELNCSGKKGWHAIPEHLQTLTISERQSGEVGIKLGVKTAPSQSPQWLRKYFLRPWATWHITLDEADKLRTMQPRINPDQPLQESPVQRGRNIGALVGGGVGFALAGLPGLAAGVLLGAATGYGVGAGILKRRADQAG